MSENPNKPARKPAGKPAAGASKSPRRRAREFALQGLYQWRIGGADEAAIEAHVHEIAGFEKADRNFFLGLLRGVLKERIALCEAIQPYLDRKFDELSPIEACWSAATNSTPIRKRRTASSSTRRSSWPRPTAAPTATST